MTGVDTATGAHDRQARAAADAAGVTVREITDDEDFQAMHRLFDGIWRPDPGNQPVSAVLLRAFSKSDNYVAGAYDGTELVGACVAFFGPPAQATMHSHVAGVVQGGGRRAVGFALKTHQRSWALHRGLRTISWTYDPLVSRNAYFNLTKLAATPAEYLTNFYGGMNDGLNGADETDRLLVSWDLAAPAVDAACAGRPAVRTAAQELAGGAVIGLGRAADGSPAAGDLDGHTVLVAAPPDIETLRRGDPAAAHTWRIAVRETLGTLMARGRRVAGFDRAGWYIVTDAKDGNP
ncbi:GNAT family N-acetyltransferase [Dactylosporangium sp. NBC_01737]|uniref:GNAT family N-acetyltransferase n=1 Tax=Dactylosporangium sp. NBC_01737 TaxID=2975959 RepID=UPI002E1656BD|nr:GNAT family N-acetyltransferase [Dactylosporangium sp. NBC_01737]